MSYSEGVNHEDEPFFVVTDNDGDEAEFRVDGDLLHLSAAKPGVLLDPADRRALARFLLQDMDRQP